ncbi:MAG TPA: hypothetical protein VFC53_02360 [Dehalococcoidia bacterium]|nr:hypothetical protein [Dehalococcoidia bacterium]
MSKPENGQDRIHREIEELLDRLDNFVPEERFTEKMRLRRRRVALPSPAPIVSRIGHRVSRVSLGQLMLAGLALMLASYFFRGPLGAATMWVLVAGLLLSGIAFVLSLTRGYGGSSTLGGHVEKRWRGQIIEYSSTPSAADRIRGWFRNRRRR